MTPQELANLDLAVARAEGKMNPRIEPETPFSDPMRMIDVEEDDMAAAVDFNISRKYIYYAQYSPSTDPVEAMRLMEKYGISLERVQVGPNVWSAQVYENEFIDETGETPYIAICRAVIALYAAREVK